MAEISASLSFEDSSVAPTMMVDLPLLRVKVTRLAWLLHATPRSHSSYDSDRDGTRRRCQAATISKLATPVLTRTVPQDAGAGGAGGGAGAGGFGFPGQILGGPAGPSAQSIVPVLFDV